MSRHHQRLIGQAQEQVGITAADVFHRLEDEAIGKDGKALEENLLWLGL